MTRPDAPGGPPDRASTAVSPERPRRPFWNVVASFRGADGVGPHTGLQPRPHRRQPAGGRGADGPGGPASCASGLGGLAHWRAPRRSALPHDPRPWADRRLVGLRRRERPYRGGGVRAEDKCLGRGDRRYRTVRPRRTRGRSDLQPGLAQEPRTAAGGPAPTGSPSPAGLRRSTTYPPRTWIRFPPRSISRVYSRSSHGRSNRRSKTKSQPSSNPSVFR